MAKSSASIIEVNQTGTASDNNGGGFDSSFGGQDWTYGVAAQVVTFNGGGVTATCTAGGTVLTITGYTVTNNEKGNWLNITGGTNFTAGRYQVTASNTGSNTLTLDGSPCPSSAGSAMTGFMGGPLASPAIAFASMVAANSIYINGTFSVTTATFNVSNGCMQMVVDGQVVSGNIVTTVRGYGTTRGDAGTATIQLAIGSASLLKSVGESGFYVRNLVLSGGSQASSTLLELHSGTVVRLVDSSLLSAVNATALFDGGTSVELVRAFVKQISSGMTFGNIQDSAIVSSAAVGPKNNAAWRRNFIISGTGIGLNAAAIDMIVENNTIHGCVSHGIETGDNTGNPTTVCRNNLLISNGGWGIHSQKIGGLYNLLENNAYWSNVSGNNNLIPVTGDVSLSGDPCVNSAATINSLADARAAFAINATAGAGAACRGAGTPSYVDIGAVQHQDSGSGGGIIRVGMNGGF